MHHTLKQPRNRVVDIVYAPGDESVTRFQAKIEKMKPYTDRCLRSALFKKSLEACQSPGNGGLLWVYNSISWGPALGLQ